MTRCLSGLKGRSAKALFVGSNPTLVSKKCNFLKITDIYYKKEIKMGKYGKDMKKFVGYFGKWLNLFSCSQVKR